MEEETEMMIRWGQVTQQPSLVAASSGEELLLLREEVDRVHLAPALQGYILALVRATRAMATDPRNQLEPGKRYLSFGASPRASLALSRRDAPWLGCAVWTMSVPTCLRGRPRWCCGIASVSLTKPRRRKSTRID